MSFISFWKLAAGANLPVADEHELAEWERRLEEWKAVRTAAASRGGDDVLPQRAAQSRLKKRPMDLPAR